MLHDARMAGLVKLRCSAAHLGERPQWAGSAKFKSRPNGRFVPIADNHSGLHHQRPPSQMRSFAHRLRAASTPPLPSSPSMSIPVVPMFRDPRTYRREALGDEAQIAKGHLPEEVMTPDFATDVTVAAITTDEGAS